MATDLETIFATENRVPATNMEVPVIEPTPTATAPVATTTATTETTSAATSTTTATTATPEITDPVKKWVKEKLNIDDENEVITGYQSLSDLRNRAAEADTLRTRTTELETQNKQLADKPTYKSDFAKKADEIFELTGGKASRETISRFYGLDPKELKGDEALDLIKQIESPTLTAEERAILRNEEYGVSDELGLTEGQKIQRKDKYNQDIAISRDKLSKLASEAFKPVSANNQPTAEEIQAEQNRIGFWEQNTNKIDSTIFKKEMAGKLKLPNGKGGVDEVEKNFSYSLPEETKRQIFSSVSKELTKAENAKFFTPDEAGVQRANTYVQNIVRNAMFDETLKAQQKYYEERESSIHERYSAVLNNTDFLNQVQPNASGKAGVVDYDKNAEEYLKRSGA